MAISSVKVTYKEGSFGLSGTGTDGVSALVVYNKATSGKLVNDTVFKVTSLADYTTQTGDSGKITAGDSYVFKEVENYYRFTNNKNKELYVVPTAKGVGDLVKADSILFKDGEAANILAASKNTVNLIGFSLQALTEAALNTDITATNAQKTAGIKEGFSVALQEAVEVAQATLDGLEAKGVPMSAVFSCPAWKEKSKSGSTANPQEKGLVSELPDWKASSGKGKNLNRVSILMTKLPGQITSVGIVIGKLSSISVERDIGEVSAGSLPIKYAADAQAGFADLSAVSDRFNDRDVIDNKGYIQFIERRGKNGYYLNTDYTLTPETNDRGYINLNRVVDKVSLLTFDLYQNRLNGKMSTNVNTGKLSKAAIADFTVSLETEIKDKMIDKGELQAVKAFIDPDQDVSKGNVNIDISIVPYNKFRSINVSLGLTQKV